VSEDRGLDPTHPQLSAAAQIDRVCDQFEAAWRSGQQPRIEDVLAQGPHFPRPHLFRELLEIELQIRQQNRESPAAEPYHRRFPDLTEAIDAIFHKVVQPRRLGDYELLEELGRGGMGVVYRARQVLLNQVVALKVLPEKWLDEPHAISRFRREMQSIGALEHPHIVRAYNAGEAQGTHFLVMEFVEGVSLQQLVARRGPLSIAAACELVRQAALGLEHAHEHGLVHRDIKPANLMLSRHGMLKILDLGLARFHAGPANQGLTQAGVPMGTVDYMAPEQWEDPSAVDIRADIYSLGCTLFFLLTGQAPYADESYDTNRKKLMAHAVAPIPTLLERRPDCPETLEELLHCMLAKEAADRFDTPAQVAEAIGLFADAHELEGLASAAQAQEQSGVVSDPGIRSSEVKTAKKIRRDSAVRKRPPPRAAQPRPWYGRVVPLASLAAGLAAVIGLVAWLAPRPHPQLSPERRQLIADLALLPGLNGQWWFDEMPWLTPFVRQSIAEALENAQDAQAVLGENPFAYLDPNVPEVQQWLLEVAARREESLSKSQRRLFRCLIGLSSIHCTDKDLAAPLDESLTEFNLSHADGQEWTAADLHTRAVLEHKLAEITKDKQWAKRAEASYQSALGQYARSASTHSLLRLLCLADAARLDSRVLNDYDQAKTRFDEALASPDAPLIFQVETLASYGVAAEIARKYDDNTFQRALDQLRGSQLQQQNHPLSAHVHERYAWSLIDRWKLKEATAEFASALRIRRTNLAESQNPFARIYMFHNEHGLAMSRRYRGNVTRARRQYDDLLTSIQEASVQPDRQQGRPGQQRYYRDLQERWSNSLERRADCELYQGAASDPRSVNLESAAQFYEQARDKAVDSGARVAIACKRSIALALTSDKKNLITARAEFDRPEVSKDGVIGEHAERVTLLRWVAKAVLTLKEEGLTDGRAALRGFLNRFDAHSEWDKDRETRELRLLCAELLLSSELGAHNEQAARADFAYLIRLLSDLQSRDQMLPYLRRYYDLAIGAAGSDAERVTRCIVASRARGKPDDSKPGEVTGVMFHFGARSGCAIVQPSGKEGKYFALEFSRQDLKAKAAGKPTEHPVKLDDELLQMIRQEQAAGQKIEVWWSDAMCWSDEKDEQTMLSEKEKFGLSATDWPFPDQLDLQQLVSRP